MALPSSGAITVLQIAAEFPPASGNTRLKSSAVTAGISNSNVGCKSFYGLSSFSYYDNPPNMSEWDTQGTGTNTTTISGVPAYKLQIERTSGKLGIGTNSEKMSKYLTGLSPGSTYTFGLTIEAWSNMKAEHQLDMYVIPGNSIAVADQIGLVSRTYSGAMSSTIVAPAGGAITLYIRSSSTYGSTIQSTWYINDIFIA